MGTESRPRRLELVINGKVNLQASVVVRVVATDPLVIRGQLYIADCKDEGNTLKPYLPEKKTVVAISEDRPF